MTKENFTSINVIIDRSGSMTDLTSETVSGYNQFVAEQQKLPGDAIFTLCLFNTTFSMPYDSVKLSEVPPLTAEVYAPGGYTALLDAVGNTINKVGSKLAVMPEEERPSKVVFLIITDGEENASKEFTKGQVQSMITHQQETYSWEFVFMGANIDAAKEAQSLGIDKRNSMQYSANAIGTQDLYRSITKGVSKLRSAVSGATRDSFFADSDPVTPADPVVDTKDSSTNQ